MSKLIKQRSFIFISLGLLLLACGPLTQLRRLGQSQDTPATQVAVITRNNRVVSEAYTKIQTLPGYRLSSRQLIPGETGTRVGYSFEGAYDLAGNQHILIQTADGQQREFYYVDGHTYVFEPQHEGWVDLGQITPETIQQQDDLLPVGPTAIQNPAEFIAQFGVTPTQATAGTLHGRPATRYTLQPLLAEIADLFEQESSNLPAQFSGLVWVDEATGALLQAKIIFYDRATGRTTQEYHLEVSEIGNIAPMAIPAPLVNPAARASATATAQAWTVLEATFDYQGTPLAFDLIPLEVSQAPNTAPPSAAVELTLRRLPEWLFTEVALELFLQQLRDRLSLGIPEQNLIISSSGYRLEAQDSEARTIQVLYFFNANLEDYNRVEVTFSGRGNPQLAPVPVNRE